MGSELKRGTAAAVALILAAALFWTPADAQIQPVVHGGVEMDTEDFQIFLAGVGLTRAGLGISPSVSVSAYHLRHPVGIPGETVTQNGFAPMAGLRNQWQTGAIGVHVGYLFTTAETAGFLPGAPSGGGDGFLTSLQANYWGGAGGGLTAQAIASYNWNTEYIWTNLRGAQQVAELGAGRALGVGAEAQWQGDIRETGYQAFQAGALAELQVSPGLRVGAVVGGKTDNRELTDRAYPYFKLEFVAFP